MNLYLIRHAISVEEGTEGGEDSERPLTEAGRKKMRQIAKGLKKIGVEPGLILSSPYARAMQTAGILEDVLKTKKEIAISENLIPLGDPDLLIAEVNEKYSNQGDLAIVGHEPMLSVLTSLLVSGGSRMEMAYKKGGVGKLSMDDLHHSHVANLDWLLTPKILVEIAKG